MATLADEPGSSLSPGERVRTAYERIEQAGRPEVWIHLRDEADAVADARTVERRLAAGEHVPLAGRTLAVKDNIDVAGIPTTAACPAFAYLPDTDADAVARLRAAGAIVIGKTNLDQFATGLVGTRSPYGAVRDARRLRYVSGGSSSGSAVAVALGLADLALGTDTAGSGRVPAAFQGIVGLKPTIGLVPTGGVVPASPTLDCVSVFAATVTLADRALWLMAAPTGAGDRLSPRADEGTAPPAGKAIGRAWPPTAPLAAPPRPRIAIPRRSQLVATISAEALATFTAAVRRLAAETVEVDIAPLQEASRLLYDGAFVAERHEAFGHFAADYPETVDPSVRAIVAGAANLSAGALIRDSRRLRRLRHAGAPIFAAADALLLPTTPFQPTIAQVAAAPLEINRALGVFTNFVNLLDLSAIAVPAGQADGGHFGVTFIAPAFSDRVLADVAADLTGEPRPAGGPTGIELLVVGAHRSGQPLNHELTDRGARYTGTARTAPRYRLYALPTQPLMPGMVRVVNGGAAIEGELWALPAAALGPFLADLPAPMALGQVELDDGRRIVGFTCEPAAIADAADITAHESWPEYLRTVNQ